jgi:hypothetical protein
MAQQVARAEAGMTVLREGRMIGDIAVETQSTEPTVGEIEVDFLAQPPLGTNAEAVADSSIRIISSGSIEGHPTSL